jgi:hypothetical protein
MPLAGLLISLVVLAGCASAPDVVILNRTNVALSVAPGVLVPPCTAIGFTRAELESAGDELLKRVVKADYSWIPEGAVLLEGGIPGDPFGAAKPMNVIVSAEAPPEIAYGPIEEADLPDCSGTPVFSIRGSAPQLGRSRSSGPT